MTIVERTDIMACCIFNRGLESREVYEELYEFAIAAP